MKRSAVSKHPCKRTCCIAISKAMLLPETLSNLDGRANSLTTGNVAAPDLPLTV